MPRLFADAVWETTARAADRKVQDQVELLVERRRGRPAILRPDVIDNELCRSCL